ncbi:hypothetical protein [Candidatus Allofournierella merdipullorum]|uniref:hypothetical protein n=1 Tax=Candidatus Allofournierella merdipullorum TaxID=2838595 RepID=UPI002A8DEF3B|nr:hypothetical protein [Candidatus Fournierella merdipullorum]
MEIERKWLVKDWPAGLEAVRTIRMRQGYIALRPTVRIREEADEAGVEYILCFKGKAGPGGLSRAEIETPVERGLFLQLEELIGKPLIHKEQRRYPLADGLTLEVNRVDPGTEHEFFYAEVEFGSEDQALGWKPGVLREYLDREVTGEKGRSMADYWAKTRGGE